MATLKPDGKVECRIIRAVASSGLGFQATGIGFLDEPS